MPRGLDAPGLFSFLSGRLPMRLALAGTVSAGLPIYGGFRGCPPDKCICVTNAYLARNMPRL